MTNDNKNRQGQPGGEQSRENESGRQEQQSGEQSREGGEQSK